MGWFLLPWSDRLVIAKVVEDSKTRWRKEMIYGFCVGLFCRLNEMPRYRFYLYQQLENPSQMKNRDRLRARGKCDSRLLRQINQCIANINSIFLCWSAKRSTAKTQTRMVGKSLILRSFRWVLVKKSLKTLSLAVRQRVLFETVKWGQKWWISPTLTHIFDFSWSPGYGRQLDPIIFGKLMKFRFFPLENPSQKKNRHRLLARGKYDSRLLRQIKQCISNINSIFLCWSAKRSTAKTQTKMVGKSLILRSFRGVLVKKSLKTLSLAVRQRVMFEIEKLGQKEGISPPLTHIFDFSWSPGYGRQLDPIIFGKLIKFRFFPLENPSQKEDYTSTISEGKIWLETFASKKPVHFKHQLTHSLLEREALLCENPD